MEKISREAIESNPHFVFAKKFLKDKTIEISSKYVAEESSLDERANRHYAMVAELTRFFMSVLELFSEKDLKDLNRKEGNINILNRYLAMRQLAEAQLDGILKGSWGLPSTITETDEFKTSIANAESNLTHTELLNAIKSE